MIRAATRLWRDRPDARFVVGNASPRCADYSVASGIFNFNPGGSRASWERYVAHTLENLHTTSRLGFAVNFKSRGTLGREPETEEYETSPQKWLRHCTEAFGRPAGIVEGYGLPEFTLLVRRNQRPRFDALPLSSSSSGL